MNLSEKKTPEKERKREKTKKKKRYHHYIYYLHIRHKKIHMSSLKNLELNKNKKLY